MPGPDFDRWSCRGGKKRKPVVDALGRLACGIGEEEDALFGKVGLCGSFKHG